MDNVYAPDIQRILAKRYDNGADLWATPDGRLIKGSPFTTLDCTYMLAELGVAPTDAILAEAARLFFSALRDDGRFRLSPDGAIYPCHTIHAVRTLCYLGYANDPRLSETWNHLLQTQYGDGGWHCNKFSFGRGPETEFSNPGPTLTALDAFRFTPYLQESDALGRTVEFLLRHWRIRTPLGPCHYGIGSRFLEVTYPFSSYNLFYYVYVLSFYRYAKADERFLEAFALLRSKMVDGQVVVERQNPNLRQLDFCRKGEACQLGTLRYQEILRNIGQA